MKRKIFQELLTKKVAVFDGATGTELAKLGMPPGVSPELFAYEHPELIAELHGAYHAAGSDLVCIPSFGGNSLKLAEFGLAERMREINRGLAANAVRAAAGRYLVFGDLSPLPEFIKPWGRLEFEEAVSIYAEQIAALADGGADGIVIETMFDLQQSRAALLAVRETAPQLPVIVTMTFDKHQRTLSGNDPRAALVTLQALGADAFGCNCSTGPEQMLEIIRLIKPYADIPLVAKPNAGMPRLIGDKTVFEMESEEFGSYAHAMRDAGVNIAGGCCGTTPRHIAALAGALAELEPIPAAAEKRGFAASGSRFVQPGAPGALRLIGERINPTGKKKLQAELREEKFDIVRDFARQQTAAGAQLLDINMGLGGGDEKSLMLRAVDEVIQASPLPLVIDSTSAEVMESALRRYPGRALVNSITAERDRLEKMLPAAARYGAMLIMLPVTDEGIPATLDGRKEAVLKIFAEAQKYGYTKADVIVDALVMTIAAGGEPAVFTLDLIEWSVREFGAGAVTGLSNVSFGLPERETLNATFLAMAMARGATCAIANPAGEKIVTALTAADALRGFDPGLSGYLARFAEAAQTAVATDPLEAVLNAVVAGDKEHISELVSTALLAGETAERVMNEALIGGITRVGDLFSAGKYFLPQLLMGADAMQAGMRVVEPLLQAAGAETAPGDTVVIATVEGDIHDIGKNIVTLMLRNYGFKVVDLGKDVSAERIVAALREYEAVYCGLSALMTTTMPRMREVIELARAHGLDGVKFVVGGAAVDAGFAGEIGAEYAKDAMETVHHFKKKS